MMKYLLLLVFAAGAGTASAQVIQTGNPLEAFLAIVRPAPRDMIFVATAQGKEQAATERAEKEAEKQVFDKLDEVLKICGGKITERYLGFGNVTVSTSKVSKKIYSAEVKITITPHQMQALLESAVSTESQMKQDSLSACLKRNTS